MSSTAYWPEEAISAMQEFMVDRGESFDLDEIEDQFDCISFNGDPGGALRRYFGQIADVPAPAKGNYSQEWLFTECAQYVAAFFPGGLVVHRFG